MTLAEALRARFPNAEPARHAAGWCLTVPAAEWRPTAEALRREAPFDFEQLMDLAAVDHLHYGQTEWTTHAATAGGFSRGVDARAGARFTGEPPPPARPVPRRFAVVCQLLSVSRNQRLMLKTWVEDDADPRLDSLVPVWPSANWYEREAFDLFGIVFEGHPDLRRILTDYGFIGHPFRKDFPLVGREALRYDPIERRIVHEPVDIEPRVLAPRVIREDFPLPGPASREEG
ncbi:MAG: NADH-quinone oxidoreductase subunit C [Gammaproteobacteria bacterium]|nr:MAG: NADH-quinone oxidoreductase subunit C [Gammaproteobacteria bacterium]